MEIGLGDVRGTTKEFIKPKGMQQADYEPVLPFELLYDVLDVVDARLDHDTLKAFALTCRTLRAPSQRRLFRRIHLSRSRPRRLKKGSQDWELAPCRHLREALESSPILGTYVEELYLAGGGLLCLERNVPAIMHACSHVQTLSVEFFVCNDKEYALVEWSDVPPAFKRGLVALLALETLTALELSVATFPMALLRVCQSLHDVVWRAIPGKREPTLLFGFPEELEGVQLYQCKVKSILLQNLSHEFQAIEDFTITEAPPFDISMVEVMKLHIDRYSAPVVTMIGPVSHSLRELELVLSSGAMKYDLEQVCFRLRDYPVLESLLVSISIDSAAYTSTRPIPWLSYIFSGAPHHTALRQVVIHTYLTVRAAPSMWPGLAMPLNLLEFPTEEYEILDEALQSVASASLETVRFLTAVERRDSTGVARRDWMPAEQVENLVRTKMPKAYSRGVIVFDSPSGQ
ncbi:hypothetical protein K525DRAFT_361158 [Schizophyllum commune Loenen D]|nr:hypothetical protein K525DRAFT_361158 [Schizophyllum commune Loenen D]